MASLDKSNVVNGNIISASDITALYDALTGDVAYDNIDFQGTASYATSALSATTATSAVSASYINIASTASGVYYPLVTDLNGIKQPKTVSSFELSGSLLTNTTASRAITASFALNSAPPVTQYVSANTSLNAYYSFAGVTEKFPGGSPNRVLVDWNAQFSSIPVTLGPLGVNNFITATPIQASPSSNLALPVFVDVDLTPGSEQLIFQTEDVGFEGNVMFMGYIK